MKEFFTKHKNNITMAINAMIVILGLVARDTKFVIIGLLLAALTIYVTMEEKKAEAQKAQFKAERKARLQEQKAKNKNNKKKKSKKRK
ncbi:hypothetical protein [Romboutsia sp. Marseille-P6047]|uniref:hypothetical protein n=1 Tax=Romboutsia sp. Marseille-P6047 TaxID=2161817 RepID=UPI000F0589D1|nr:hypothetical protein [Romboutsia sp. Marseille-P6047]